jgi:hypothetical protein
VRTIRSTQIHFQIIHKNSVRISQETHYVSATKPHRLRLFGETVAVYCENHTERSNTLTNNNKNSVRTSQETHYVSATKPNRLMLFREQSLFIVRTIRSTQIHFQIIYKNSVRISQETHYVSDTKTNRLRLFVETGAVYCENHMEHTNTLTNNTQELSSYLTGNTLRLRYKAQPVNAV